MGRCGGATRVGTLSQDGPRGPPSSARAPASSLRWLDGLDWRRDLALPAVLLVVQLAGAAATVAGHHSPTTHLGPADWVLLVVGPLALVFRRRWPVAVLWVAFAATLTPSGAWSANLSLIVAFFLAATSGHRRAAWVVIVVGYLCSVWLAPLAYGNPVGSLTFALALGRLAGRAGDRRRGRPPAPGADRRDPGHPSARRPPPGQ